MQTDTDLRRCHRILELIMVDIRVAIWRAAIQKRSEHAPQANEHTLMLFVRYSKTFKWFLTSTVQLDQCEVGSILQVQQWGDQSTKCTHVQPTPDMNCNQNAILSTIILNIILIL